MALECFWRCDVCNQQEKAVGPFDPPEKWEKRRIQSAVMGPPRTDTFNTEARTELFDYVLCPSCQVTHPPNVLSGLDREKV